MDQRREQRLSEVRQELDRLCGPVPGLYPSPEAGEACMRAERALWGEAFQLAADEALERAADPECHPGAVDALLAVAANAEHMAKLHREGRGP